MHSHNIHKHFQGISLADHHWFRSGQKSILEPQYENENISRVVPEMFIESTMWSSHIEFHSSVNAPNQYANAGNG